MHTCCCLIGLAWAPGDAGLPRAVLTLKNGTKLTGEAACKAMDASQMLRVSVTAQVGRHLPVILNVCFNSMRMKEQSSIIPSVEILQQRGGQLLVSTWPSNQKTAAHCFHMTLPRSAQHTEVPATLQSAPEWL
jgi:hypothetical protein